MRSDTPAREIRTKDLEANRLALEDCLERIPPERVLRILDIRYGLGGWARSGLERFPHAELMGFERDSDTADAAYKDDRISLFEWQFRAIRGGHVCDLLLADFNTVTVLKRSELDEALSLLRSPSKYLVFTDVACSKLHLNYRSYGLDRPSLEDYWKAFLIDGYRFETFSRRHYGASTALYVREKK